MGLYPLYVTLAIQIVRVILLGHIMFSGFQEDDDLNKALGNYVSNLAHTYFFYHFCQNSSYMDNSPC